MILMNNKSKAHGLISKSQIEPVFIVFLLILLLFINIPFLLASQPLISGEALVKELRKGGYNIYFRHAATHWSQDDFVNKSGEWTSCDPMKMRQLSDEGRNTAIKIGEALRLLKIPIGNVFSSEYCRAKETAELFGLGKVSTTKKIMNLRVADMVGGRQVVIERARMMLAEMPKPGTNTILVAHGNLMLAATGAYPGEAGAGVFKPKGDGSFQLVAELTPQNWIDLTE